MYTLERILSRVQKTDTCWLWLGALDTHGYGQVGIENKTRLVHRLIYKLMIGNIPPGMLVCHKCDNPKCVNPDHLFLGTQQDNMSDMAMKHRSRNSRGENNPRAKLTYGDVAIIRSKYQSGITQRKLAKEFGVCQSTIAFITRGEHWSNEECSGICGV